MTGQDLPRAAVSAGQKSALGRQPAVTIFQKDVLLQ
jgi:hypothetical protein